MKFFYKTNNKVYKIFFNFEKECKNILKWSEKIVCYIFIQYIFLKLLF